MAEPPASTTSLEAVRARIDAVDDALLRLLDERAALAAEVAAAKKAAANGGGAAFGLRPARETQVLRRLLARPHPGASTALVVRLWRELMGESLAAQGPFSITAFAGRDPARMAELARLRFGAAPPLTFVDKPEEAIAAARKLGGVGLLPLDAGAASWGRLLVEPGLRCFAVLPCLATWGAPAALAIAAVDVEPSGADQTLWITDAVQKSPAITDHLSRQGLAAELLREAGGLKLFTLAGYVQPEDARLEGAPGRISGVIGAAPTPFDL
jgi:chorismate mutase